MKELRKLVGRNKVPQVWYVSICEDDPKSYVVRWGILDGLLQEAKKSLGTCGVIGHSDYKTEEEYVGICIEREIKKKKEEGYVEYIDGVGEECAKTTIDFNSPLPKNLCFYKPQKEISDKKLSTLIKNGNVIWTIKRDGMMHISVKSNGNWEIYSRRMDVVTDKYPHIVKALNNLDMPNNTILLGEMVLLKDNGQDDFKGLSRIYQSDLDLALAYQGFAEFPKDRENESVIGNPSYYVFDIAFYNGVDLVQTKSTGERIDLLKNIFCMSPALQSDGHDIDWFNSHMYFDMALMKKFIGPIRYMSLSEITDLDLAKKMKIEGFVVVDLNARYGDRAYSFDGKAQRPEGIYKRKPLFDEEVIIGGYEIGSGRNGDKLGAIFIEQIHPKSGLRIKCGKVGTGFTNEQREMFWEQKENLIGKTIKIEFAARQAEKDGEFAFKFPVFKGFADKRPDECIAQHLENDDE